MMIFGQLPNARAAQALIDYLKSQDVMCEMRVHDMQVQLLVQAADYVKAEAEYQYFLQHPHDDKYLQASWEYGDTQSGLNYGKPIKQLIAEVIHSSGPVTLTILVLCIGIFTAWNIGFADTLFSYLGFFHVIPSASIEEFWRVFTPSLIHFSAMHIIFNLLWWWYLGGKIEQRLGSAKLMVILVVAGTLPNVVQYLLQGPNFGGLSGVVYALAGYSYVMGLRKPEAGIALQNSFMGFMMLWLLLGFTDAFGLSIANGAHVGGLLVGIAQGLFDSRQRNQSTHS
ncbi:rhomboid family intramembrane serine protease GlpG [Shewanella sp. NIFS-20-20]|uniref:rhomboid family intramembrane serine protease GlpG n=1 Tax=Shewanella sp. NIFS-20-20 TaxID=2853806 RepID=UPI001C487F09|nr:rhomboid family intramembrane serine protease GlpG [Shewanella sp. NIFS-20-20]MBV7316113.1 rhomboid family intramembrane serine protease GlpG [Shewanella sp. NIFS-20-20]